MIRRLGWLDGLRGRIAAVLLAALLIQFVGGEIIFKVVDNDRMQRGRTLRLTERLEIAEDLLETQPHLEPLRLMNRLSHPDLSLSIARTLPPHLASADAGKLSVLRDRIVAACPEIDPDTLHLVRAGEALEGGFPRADGTWLLFRADNHFRGQRMLFHYTASLLLLFACVVIVALLFGRMIGRPLRQIAEAADRAGRDEPVTVTVDGPREVRQVASAFEAMQTRLLGHIRERVQSLAAMSHDLRTPLARLRLNASTVTDPETRHAIEEDVAEMEGFVGSVLDYLKGDDAEPEQRADIASIVMTVVDEARDSGIEAEYSGPERLETVTRPMKLKRIVRNLVQNAGRHAGNARVDLDAGTETIVITVEDDGPGIAEGDLETVFEPFTRLEVSRNRKSGGAGLGLAIVRRLVTRLGGSVALANRREGGLRATVRLPPGHWR